MTALSRARYRDWKLMKPWVMISFGVAVGVSG